MILSVEDIGVSYGLIKAIHSVSFHVNQGELVTIVGSNGSGKTTILKTISGILRSSKGRILFDGKDITHTSTMDIVKLGLIHIPESRRIFGPLSVEENLKVGAYSVNSKAVIYERLQNAYELFPRLHERRKQKGETLSGGEQQMLAIARGLMGDLKLLLLDEPSLGLMPKLVDEVFDKIAEFKRRGMTILLVEQNVRSSLEISDRGYILQTGKTVHSDKSENLLASDLIRKAFLGL